VLCAATGRRLKWLTHDGSPHRTAVSIATWGASVLTAASGAIHLHLYTVGYRAIPTIGPLFLLQGVVSIAVAVCAAALRRVWTMLLGASWMLATLAGFLISVNFGLFGFQDTFRGFNQVVSFVVELIAVCLFLSSTGLALSGLRVHRRQERPD
jgi:hypothetical protein